MDRTPILSVHNDELEEALELIKEFLESLDCVENVKVENGDIQFKHKWSKLRYLSQAIQQLFKKDYRPGLDVWGAIQDHLLKHHIQSRLERWE
jgi:hypothetical protein